jgi:hypothetical protein
MPTAFLYILERYPVRPIRKLTALRSIGTRFVPRPYLFPCAALLAFGDYCTSVKLTVISVSTSTGSPFSR